MGTYNIKGIAGVEELDGPASALPPKQIKKDASKFSHKRIGILYIFVLTNFMRMQPKV